jgi:hypothetical protein
MHLVATEAACESALCRSMDLGCLKGRATARTGENDADDRSSLASRHEAISAGRRPDSTPARTILQAVNVCTARCAGWFNKRGSANIDQLG